MTECKLQSCVFSCLKTLVVSIKTQAFLSLDFISLCSRMVQVTVHYFISSTLSELKYLSWSTSKKACGTQSHSSFRYQKLHHSLAPLGLNVIDFVQFLSLIFVQPHVSMICQKSSQQGIEFGLLVELSINFSSVKKLQDKCRKRRQ